MSQPKIFVTHPIPIAGIDLLRQKGYHVKVGSPRTYSKNELHTFIRGCDAALSLLTDPIDEAFFLAAGKSLKIVANYAVGFDNIDVPAAKKHGVVITNTPGVLDGSVAEHAIALMMAVARRVVEADQFVRDGKYVGWRPLLFLGNCLHDKTLGIIGLGRIGSEVARRLADGFDMKLLYHDAFRNRDLEKKLRIQYVSLKKLLTESDFITVHVPLLPSTRHLIGRPEFSLMKPSAYIINTSRGQVIDERALVDALRKKKIRGAGLDVFEHEPKLTTGLTKLDNVVLTPHIASATEEARDGMALLCAQNIIAVLSGKKPLTPVKES